MLRSRLFTFVMFVCLLTGLAFGCQSRQTYTSRKLGLTISYPADWDFVGESEESIMLRSFYGGDAAIKVTILGPRLSNITLTALLEEQLELWAQESDPNRLVEYGEIREISHERFSIVTGRVSGYSKVKVSSLDPLFHTYIAIIRFQDRTVVVTAEGTGHESPQNAIEEIIKGLEFR